MGPVLLIIHVSLEFSHLVDVYPPLCGVRTFPRMYTTSLPSCDREGQLNLP